ncbi:MAG: DUF998 domain-containing protein [Promethearchaeota archaeon]|nr:MAG: DUF998 domain-containing protein [Candidatus Lokiarchaeota archaeon]
MRINVKKILNFVSGGNIGLFSVGIIIFGELIAFLLFPGYNIFENMVSELGTGPGGMFFNLSIFISGIIIIPYYIKLAQSFDGTNINDKMKQYAIFVAIISCVTYSFIGLFPALEENIIIYTIHGTMAAISIGSGMGYLIFYSILMLKADNYSNYQAVHGIIVAVFYATFLLTWIPIIEWFMNFAILSWIIANSLYLIKNRY